MGGRRRIWISLLVASLFAAEARSATLRVPSDYPTLQGAIDASSDGDVIVVAPGVYPENLGIIGKVIEIRSEEGPAATVLDGGGSGSVVTVMGCPWIVLEGFTIVNGNASGLGNANTNGGGICCIASGPTIRDNVITGNITGSLGGGLYFDESWAVVHDNVIEGNVAFEGGGVAFRQSADQFFDNIVVGNSADDGGGIIVSGRYGPTSTWIEGNEIRGNEASRGGGLYLDWCADALILRNRIISNTGDLGGGILSEEAGFVVTAGNDISWNFAVNLGGGFCSRSTYSTLVGNRISGNATWGDGGGVYILEWEGSGGCATRDSRVLQCTIAGNVAGGAGGGIVCGLLSSPTIRNTIVWGNDAAIAADIHDDRSDVRVVDCVVRGGWPGEGNLEDDPMFVDPSRGDYRLRIGSPCVDRGGDLENLPDLDWEGDPRVVDGDLDSEAVVDIGADEMIPEVAARFGTVNAANGAVAGVLTIDGSTGDRRRIVRLHVLDHVTIDVAPPPAGPEPAPFAVYAWDREPEAGTLVLQPFRLGVTCFATPLQPELPQPAVIWNNLGREERLGIPGLPSSPAPSTLFSKLARHRATVTLQGFIRDDGSAADGPVSVTNAIVLEIVD
jgi:hypothetical protein